jgi:uncharacterized membrane protein YccC
MMPSFRNLTKVGPWFKEAVLLALTSVVSLCLAQGLRLPQGYWTVISSIIVLQANVTLTLQTSWSRLAGTAIGAVTGAVCYYYLGSHIGSFGFAIVVAVFACLFMGLKDSYRFAGVTVVIVMLINRPESPWMTAFYRFLEVSLGILVAIGMLFLSDVVGRFTDKPR